MAKTIRILKRKLYEAEEELTANDSSVEQTNTDNNTDAEATTAVPEELASDNTQNQNNQQAEDKGYKIEYVGSNNPAIESGIKNQVEGEFATNIIKDTTLFKVKMSFSFQKDIHFPTASTLLNALMSATSMPKKFQNIYSSYDNNPLKTISEAEDLAVKYFEALKPEEPKQVKDESQLANSENASVLYNYNNYLNEGAFGAGFGFGHLLGNAFNAIGAALGGAGLGFGFGAAPVIIGAKAGGKVLGARGSDHGEWPTDDRELHKQYDETKTDTKSGQNEVTQAIGSYVNNLLIVLEQGLQHITSGNSSKDISEFSDIVIDALNNRSKEMTDLFIEDNNKRLKEAKKNKIEKLLKLSKIKEKVPQRVAQRIARGEFPLITPEDYIAYMSDNPGDIKNKEAQKILKRAESEEAKKLGVDDDDLFSNAIQIPFNLTYNLNEALGDDSDIVFDADSMYSEFQRLFRQKMNLILTSKPEDWDIVKTAKKLMEALRDGATKEIETSIQHVCRLASGDQLGVSSKIQGFLSKHPLRAAKLTNLWKRHETDLNFRIELRIKQISELDGKGPLGMAREFYRNTIPNLLAMMIVYKTLYTMYQNEKLCNPAIALGNLKTVKNVEEQVNIMKNVYPTALAMTFGQNSLKLSNDGKAVYNYDSNSFEVKNIDYLFLLINGLIKPEKYNQKILLVAEDLNTELQGYVASNKVNEFFSRLADFILLDCGAKKQQEAVQLLYNAFANLNADDIKQLTDIDPGVVAAIPDNPVSPVILAYIDKTKGDFLYRYTQTPNILVDANEESINKAKESWNIKDIEVDNVNSFIESINKASGAFRSIQSGKINENLLHYIQAYNDMQLYKLSDIKMNPFKVMSTFISMCSNPALSTMFNNTAVIEAYEAIRDKWQEKGSSNETWDAYIKDIAYNDKEYNELSVKGLSIDNADAFSSFVRSLKSEVENVLPEEFDKFFKDEKTKNIPTPGGLTSWESIANQIVTNEKYTSLSALMTIGINTGNDYKNLVFGSNAIKLLKSLLAYSLKVEKVKFIEKGDMFLAILNKLWFQGKIKAGDGTNTLLNVIDLLQDNYKIAKNNPKHEKAVARIIKNANDEFRANSLPGESANKYNQELFDLLINTDTKFKDAEDIVKMLKKNLYYDTKPISEDHGHALNDYIIAMCNYIEDFKNNKALNNLLALASKLAPKNPDLAIDDSLSSNATSESYNFYFGIREFQFLNEDDNKSNVNMDSFLDSPLGEAWLNALAGDDSTLQLTDDQNNNEELQQTEQSSQEIDANIVNDILLLAKAADNAKQKLNNSSN